MAVHDPYNKEMEAFQALADLLARAKATKILFEDANLSLPAPLSRLLGTSDGTSAKGDGGPKMIVSPPKPPPRPSGAQDDWIWIEAAELTPTSLVLSILRDQIAPMNTKALFEKVIKHLPRANMGSMLNIGARLDGDVIVRSEQGWAIKDKTLAPVLHDGFAWGPTNVFGKPEMAGHRRSVILHILRASGGLQVMQIVRQLQESQLCQAPVSKDLVKADLETLRKEGKVRKVGNSKRWTVTAPKPPKGDRP